MLLRTKYIRSMLLSYQSNFTLIDAHLVMLMLKQLTLYHAVCKHNEEVSNHEVPHNVMLVITIIVHVIPFTSISVHATDSIRPQTARVMSFVCCDCYSPLTRLLPTVNNINVPCKMTFCILDDKIVTVAWPREDSMTTMHIYSYAVTVSCLGHATIKYA